jgi:hypothetical protein
VTDEEFSIEVAYNGQPRTLEIEAEEKVTAVLERSIKLFGITQQPHLLSLYFADGTVVDESKLAAEAGLTPGITVYLRPNVVKGG